MKEVTIRIPDPSPRNIAVTVLLLAGLIFTWYYSTRTTEPEHVHEESEAGPGDKVTLTTEGQQNAQIQTMKIKPTPLQEWLEAPGVVEPDLNRVSRIRLLARGIVRRVHVRPGDRVAAGQVLFDYDNIELGELVGEYRKLLSEEKKLAARARLTEQAADRAETLFTAQALSKKELEVRIAEQQEAQAELEALRASLNAVSRKARRFGVTQDRIGSLSTDNSSLDTVRAPQDAVILDFEIAPGEILAADQDVMTLANLERVWVIASVYEKDLARVRTNRSAQISFSSFPEKKFVGTVTQIAERLDPETRTAMVRVEVNNAGRDLKLKMFGTVRLPTDDPHIVPAVPESALQQIEGKDSVFVQLSQNEFQKRNVKLGHKADDWVEILEGISLGELVVTKGSFYLKSTLLKETLSEDHH
jgi:cobalt-zinc-cadmium efflux system membrane fusion protein